MNHRHLLPDEIDLLLDDEVGFGVSPLKAHVRECVECHTRLRDARRVVDILEDIPHFAPSRTFPDRVMSQVPVFVPWHVAARASVVRWLPSSRPARIAVAALTTSMASLLTVAILWIAIRTDALQLTMSVAGDRARDVVFVAGRAVLATLVGDQMFTIIQHRGTLGIVAALLAFAALAGGSVVGLRALAVASSRRRA